MRQMPTDATAATAVSAQTYVTAYKLYSRLIGDYFGIPHKNASRLAGLGLSWRFVMFSSVLIVNFSE